MWLAAKFELTADVIRQTRISDADWQALCFFHIINNRGTPQTNINLRPACALQSGVVSAFHTVPLPELQAQRPAGVMALDPLVRLLCPKTSNPSTSRSTPEWHWFCSKLSSLDMLGKLSRKSRKRSPGRRSTTWSARMCTPSKSNGASVHPARQHVSTVQNCTNHTSALRICSGY